jgi:hypothetical protein
MTIEVKNISWHCPFIYRLPWRELSKLQFRRWSKNPTIVFLLRSIFFDDFLSSCPLNECVVIGGMWLARIIRWVVHPSFWGCLLFRWRGLNTLQNMIIFKIDILTLFLPMALLPPRYPTALISIGPSKKDDIWIKTPILMTSARSDQS